MLLKEGNFMFYLTRSLIKLLKTELISDIKRLNRIEDKNLAENLELLNTLFILFVLIIFIPIFIGLDILVSPLFLIGKLIGK
jgi:hypothetical protein